MKTSVLIISAACVVGFVGGALFAHGQKTQNKEVAVSGAIAVLISWATGAVVTITLLMQSDW